MARSPVPWSVRTWHFAEEGPSCGRCFPGGGPTMSWGKVTAQQVLSKQICTQHICWELSGEWEGSWPLLEGHFSQPETCFYQPANLNRKRGLLSWPRESIG